MWMPSWEYGLERQREMLRQAEKWREINAFRSTRSRRVPRIIGMLVGRVLIVVGQRLAPGTPQPEVELRLETN